MCGEMRERNVHGDGDQIHLKTSKSSPYIPQSHGRLQSCRVGSFLWGVESATGLLRPLSSRPPDLLMHGWLSMDRVIDAPVYQDILTWERLTRTCLSAFQVLEGPFQPSSLHLL